MKIGKANYGAKKNTFKIKDGDNIYRILPPLGKLAEKGRWSQYYRVEWGFKDTDGINRPFQDVRVVNRASGMIEVESPAYLQREKLKAAKAKTIELFKAGQASKEDVAEATELVKRYNLDSKHYLNVVNLNGEIGLLKIGHKAKLALDSEINKLRKQGIDPLGLDNGRFFNFHRSCPTGNFRDTMYQVTVYEESKEVGGQIAKFEKVHKMDDEFISRLEGEAFELSGMYPTVTAGEVQEMVDGGAEAVDRILGRAKERSSGGGASSSGAGGSSGSSDTTKVELAANSSTTTVEASAALTSSDLEAAESEEITATEAAAPAEELPEAGTAASQDQSDEDFLRSIGAI